MDNSQKSYLKFKFFDSMNHFDTNVGIIKDKNFTLHLILIHLSVRCWQSGYYSQKSGIIYSHHIVIGKG